MWEFDNTSAPEPLDHDESLWFIPPNHPLIVISDDEETEVKIKIGKEVAEVSRKRGRGNDNQKSEFSKKIKLEKNDEGSSSGSKIKVRLKAEKDICNSRDVKIEFKPKDNNCVSVRKNEVKGEDITLQSKLKSNVKFEGKFDLIPNTNVKRVKSDSVNGLKPGNKISSESSLQNKLSSYVKPENKSNFYPNTVVQRLNPERAVSIPKIGSGLIWESSMLARWAKIDRHIAESIIEMLKNEYTVPFMARYRREKTNNMEADKLRHVKDCYENIKALERKAATVMKQIEKQGELTPQLKDNINSVQSMDELDFICAPYKKGSSKSKAEKAKAIGLGGVAENVLFGNTRVNIEDYVDKTKDGLKTKDDVILGIRNIIADIFSKDEAVLGYLREIESQVHITITSTRMKTRSCGTDKDNPTKNEKDSEGKFELYYEFGANTSNLRPHQILALNRGESQKVLSLKFTINDWLKNKLFKFCEHKWLHRGCFYSLRRQMFDDSFTDSYNRLISPFMIRRRRSALNRKAQFAAIENFAVNLKCLLQTPPVKGCSILGIDPGFRHGFKFALISAKGDVLWNNVFYFETGFKSQTVNNTKHMSIIKEILILNKCELVAIGNGLGCRVIEKIISDFILKGFFQPEINLQYTMVNERGASIYSCSDVAKKEFPELDPNLISAVFIARTLQDPLNEFVKVQPQNLGVGMYQHDVSEKKLASALDDIVQECVSFTGVDVNTASIYLLKRIAGLGATKAANIIEWREKYGAFTNRQQLTKVKGIGPKSFEQCSGFVRIHPKTALCSTYNLEKNNQLKSNSNEYNPYNPLDRTWIHPESYKVAEKFIQLYGLQLEDFGTKEFINKVTEIVAREGIKKIADALGNQPENTVSLITEALKKNDDYDYRSQFSKPNFRKSLTDVNSVVVGVIMTGVVSNVTHFGAFVDLGIGHNGLVHNSKMNNFQVRVGDKIEIEVIDVEAERNRIACSLLRKLG